MAMRRRDVLAGGAALAVGLAKLPQLADAATTPSWHRPIVCGGHGHVCGFDPATGEAMFGGDVWGYHRTNDIFGEWLPCMMGQTGIGGIYSRGLAFSISNPGVCYAGVGTLKAGSGYFGVSVGNALTSRSTKVGFATALTGSAGSPDPRPAGRLIDVQSFAGTEVIWVASRQGIAKSTDGGHTWTTPVAPILTGQSYKAVCALDANTALACKWRTSGLIKVTSGGQVTTLTPPGILHSINKIGSTIWACGPGGLYKWNGSNFVSSPFPAGVEVADIDGSPDGQTLYVGTANQTTAAKDAYKSTDGGATWATIGQNVRPTLANGQAFWLQTVVHNHMGDTNWSCTMVAVNPRNPLEVLWAGKNGGAGTKDGGANIYQCAPGGDETNGVRAGPGSSQFTCTDTDWVGVTSTDGFQTYQRTTSPGTVGQAFSVTVGGHTYVLNKNANPRTITKDGVSIADDVFRGGCIQPTGMGVSASGIVLVSLYTGGVLVWR